MHIILNCNQFVKEQKVMQKSVTDKYLSANVILKEKENLGALLIGDCTSAVDKHIIKPHKIQTIITFGLDGAPQKKEEGVNYIIYNVLDNKSQKVNDMFDSVFDQIEQARKSGGVLINCYTGISRSSSFVIAYIMRKKFMSYDDAKAFVKKQRNLISPNDNFHRQLQAYWKVLLKREEEERLRKENEEREKKEKERDKDKDKDKQLQKNQSLSLSSNMSNFSKKTFRGARGAVRPAMREQRSVQIISIEDADEKEFQQGPKAKENVSFDKQREEPKSRRKIEEKIKDVKGVYGNKTKVI